jgi:hypothetical protein
MRFTAEVNTSSETSSTDIASPCPNGLSRSEIKLIRNIIIKLMTTIKNIASWSLVFSISINPPQRSPIAA